VTVRGLDRGEPAPDRSQGCARRTVTTSQTHRREAPKNPQTGKMYCQTGQTRIVISDKRAIRASREDRQTGQTRYSDQTGFENSWILLRFWWAGAELNCRHEDFQSSALPTELPAHPDELPIPRGQGSCAVLNSYRSRPAVARYASPGSAESNEKQTKDEGLLRRYISTANVVKYFTRASAYLMA
jgi:hypothetical protein